MISLSNFTFTNIPQKQVNCKVINCGNTIQVYLFDNPYLINEKGYEKVEIKNKNLSIEYLEQIEDNLILEENYKKDFTESLKTIEKRNILRAKNELCRLVYANEEIFKSFITLTFEEEFKNLDLANKEFHKFITKIKRTYGAFSYIVIPEFQKNGKIHYHLLTNIDFYTSTLINENFETIKLYQNKTESQIKEIQQKFSEKELLKKYDKKELNKLPVVFRNLNGKMENCKCSYSKKKNDYNFFKTIKYWNKGFSNVIPIENISVVGYMSKYMTKDIDNRLFGYRKYSYSLNLKKPQISYLNLKDKSELEYFQEIYENYDIKVSNNYKDKFGNDINFFEFRSK